MSENFNLTIHSYKNQDLPKYTKLIHCSDPINSIFSSLSIGLLETIIRGRLDPTLSGNILKNFTYGLSLPTSLSTHPYFQSAYPIIQNLLSLISNQDYSKSQVTEWLWDYLLPGTHCINSKVIYVLRNMMLAIIKTPSLLEKIEKSLKMNTEEILELLRHVNNFFEVSVQILLMNEKHLYVQCDVRGLLPMIWIAEVAEGEFALLRTENLDGDQFDSKDIFMYVANIEDNSFQSSLNGPGFETNFSVFRQVEDNFVVNSVSVIGNENNSVGSVVNSLSILVSEHGIAGKVEEKEKTVSISDIEKVEPSPQMKQDKEKHIKETKELNLERVEPAPQMKVVIEKELNVENVEPSPQMKLDIEKKQNETKKINFESIMKPIKRSEKVKKIDGTDEEFDREYNEIELKKEQKIKLMKESGEQVDEDMNDVLKLLSTLIENNSDSHKLPPKAAQYLNKMKCKDLVIQNVPGLSSMLQSDHLLLCNSCKSTYRKSDFEPFECGFTCLLCFNCRSKYSSQTCQHCSRPYSEYEKILFSTLENK